MPHWKDNELVLRFIQMFQSYGLVGNFRKSAPGTQPTIKAINPRDEPLKVVAEIGACRRIVTSSLHGMVVADAFGIPRRVEISNVLRTETEGGDFKFRDYSLAIHSPFVTGKMYEPSRWAVEDARFSVHDAYKALERELHDI